MTQIYAKNNEKMLEKRGRLLVGYLVAGYPDRDGFIEILRESVKAGLDVVEVGYPSRDPYNDSKAIQDAHRAVDAGVFDDLDYWRQIRAAVDVPIWIMGYGEDLVDTGMCYKLAEAGVVDAYVIPNVTPDRRGEMAAKLSAMGVDVLGLVNPDTPGAEMTACLSGNAMIYMQLYAGPTGMKVTQDHFSGMLAQAKLYSHTRVFAGFGIDEPERVRYLLRKGFDGVVVGTAMIKKLDESPQSLYAFIRQMKAATEGGELP